MSSYETLITPALWALTFGVALVFAARGALAVRRGSPARGPFVKALAVAVAAFVIVPAIGIVPAGHRGVVYDVFGGVETGERGEGVTFLAPWFQHLRLMTVRTQKLAAVSTNQAPVPAPAVEAAYAQSSDLQEITVLVSVNYRVDPGKAAELYRDVGFDYAQKVILPALYQRTKVEVGLIKAENFASNREKLAADVQQQLTAQLSGYGIVVEYVNVEDAIFDMEFIGAVKAKVIADQYAEEQKRLVDAEEHIKEQEIWKAKARGQSVLIEAKNQARANDRLAASLTATLLRWKWLTTWDGRLPSTLAGGSVALLLDGRKTAAFEEELPFEEDFGETTP